MERLKSLDELKKIRDKAALETRLRETGENPDSIVIAVGMATCGIAAGARVVMNAIVDEINKPHQSNTSVAVIATGCIGQCYMEPIVEVRLPGQLPIRYGNVDESRARQIAAQVLRGELDGATEREAPI